MHEEANKEKIEKFIVFVNDLTTKVFYEKLKCNGEYLYQNGACYEFVNIIKRYFEIDNILINKEYSHCAFEYKNDYYDSMGIIKNKENYFIATEEDILYMVDQFGGHLFSYHICETIIDEISHIEKIPYLPSKFYKTKKLIK